MPIVFERPHHQRIAHVLSALDGEWLGRHGCLFGGGTCIALRFGEYRESVDIDFLVDNAEGYRALRHTLTGDGLNALVRDGAPVLRTLREVRADQYGIRTQVQMDGAAIKFEIVREARIVFETPAAEDRVCGVPKPKAPMVPRWPVTWPAPSMPCSAATAGSNVACTRWV